MATLSEIRARFTALKNPTNLYQVVGLSVQETEIDLLFQLKDQLYQGKSGSGENISPTYQDDPYFKSRESAQRYSDWKDEITPDPRRKKGVPNLYITGFWYDSLKLFVSGESMEVTGAIPDIISKYGPEIVRLNPHSRTIYIDNSLNERFIINVKKFLNL